VGVAVEDTVCVRLVLRRCISSICDVGRLTSFVVKLEIPRVQVDRMRAVDVSINGITSIGRKESS
jgi:hypothetical protein